jgi:hypothetical protein
MNTFCGNVFDLISGNYIQSVSSTVEFTDVKATYFPTGSDLVVVGEHTGSTNGGITESPDLPASVAAVLSWQAGVYWRGGKPRTYLCGLTESHTTSQTQLDSATITNLLTVGDGLITGFNALASGNFNSITFGLVSFFSGGTLRTPPVFFPISGVAVHSRIDTQRRRLGK